jgi:hypothetical protein
MKNWKHLAALITALLGLVLLSSCTTQADSVNHNLDKEAESFRIARNISFVNGITDQEMLRVTGFCSLEYEKLKIDVTCKVDDKFLRHTLAKSDNVFVVSEQIEGANVSDTRYKFVIRPGALIPDLELQ